MTARRLSVLLVEDSQLLADRLREAIATVPDTQLIAIVDSEATALATLKQHPIDVVVLDLHLRRGTGFGVLRALRSSEISHALAIVLTNHNLGEYRRAAAALGAMHFLDKLHDLERLPELLAQIRADTNQTTNGAPIDGPS